MGLGARVRARRRQLGLKQHEVATAAALNKNTISRVECGSLVNLTGAVLARLAVALSTTTDHLLGLAPTPEVPSEWQPVRARLRA